MHNPNRTYFPFFCCRRYRCRCSLHKNIKQSIATFNPLLLGPFVLAWDDGGVNGKNIYLRFRSTYLFSVITLAEVVVDVQVSVMTADNIAKTVWSLIFAVLVVIDNFWHGRLIVMTRVLIHTEFAS